jgi:Uma2 family endonuclease
MQQYPLSASAKFLVHDDGVYGPLMHQSMIARLTAGLYPLYRSGQIPYEPLPETMLTEGYATPVPDVILYDHQAEETKVIIEVCKTSGEKSDLRKVIQLIDDEDYGILEGFVYNYKTDSWVRYRKGDGGQATETAYSDVLRLNLNDFL